MQADKLKNRGFTLAETIIGMLVISLLMLVTYRVFSYIISQRNRGTVDIQELQGARNAINHLRRDFRGAAPVISSSATLTQRKVARKLPVVKFENFSSNIGYTPVMVSNSELHFFKNSYKTPSDKPKANREQINYRIDTKRKCLIRTCNGVETAFADIREAKFELYSHPVHASVPMLLVSLVIDAESSKNTGARSFFELTTTISSSLTSPGINYPTWNAGTKD